VNDRIHYTKPSITELEVAYATDAARNGWGERCYEYIGRFEEEFRTHLGAKYAIATSSCTGALHMGIDPAQAEAAITPKTKAIVAVHLYGNLCDMNRLMAIGEKHGVAIIEDAAEALGSIYHNKRAGSMGAFGAFSFHGSKTITTGEGGMFVTDDADCYETVLTLSDHGRARGQTKQFWPDMIGFKYKMSNIQAALGCAQLQRIDELIADKRRVFKAYQERLCDYPLKLNPEPPGTINGYWMPTMVFDRETNVRHEAIGEAFKRANIDARTFFHPLSSLGLFEGAPRLTASAR
jgi:perosamine synthetase